MILYEKSEVGPVPTRKSTKDKNRNAGERGAVMEVPPSITQHTDCSISTIHHVLQASRRRLTVELMTRKMITSASAGITEATTTTPSWEDNVVVSVRRLAKEIVSVEEGVSLENATGEPYHNVYTALIQTHLPKLDAVAAIEYNSDRKTVTPDQNLLAFALVAAITAPVTKLLFHDSGTKLYKSGTPSARDAIND